MSRKNVTAKQSSPIRAVGPRQIGFMIGAFLVFILIATTTAHADGSLNFDNPDLLDDNIMRTRSIAWGDMDGDGDLDLAVANRDDPNQLYRNDGDGHFEPTNALGKDGNNATSIAWGDMDGDGDLDLAVGGFPSHIYRNNGDGHFRLFSKLDTEAYGASSVAWGDMDGDGYLDLAVGMERGDIDGDGYLDLPVGMERDLCLDHAVGGNCKPNQVYQNRIRQEGQFKRLPNALGEQANDARSIAWGDADGDGDLDLAVGGQINRLYRNLGAGRFVELGDALDRHLADEYSYTNSIAWGDIDNDGDLDLAAGNTGAFIWVYRNLGGDHFEATELPRNDSIVNWLNDTQSVAWGDADGDGDLDLAVGEIMVSGALTDTVSNRIYVNNSRGDFIDTYQLTGSSDRTTSVAWGDIDGDSALDLAISSSDAPIYIYHNLGIAHFTTASALPLPGCSASVAWGDMDGDGDLDLAAGNRCDANQIYRNKGGLLEPTNALGKEMNKATSVAWGDMEGDGDLDLAISGAPSRIYRNLGGSNFELTNTLGTLANGARGIGWGDMDADGDLDLAVSGQTSQLFRNNGNGQFEPTESLGTQANGSTSMAWGDMDGDGDLDLAVAGSTSHIYENLYESVGEADFRLASTIGAGNSHIQSLIWGDMDGDGDLDLAASRDHAPNQIYKNEGGGHFVNQVGALGSDSGRTFVSGIAWGDIDADGDLDLAVGRTRSVETIFYNGVKRIVANGEDRVYVNDGMGHFKQTIIPKYTVFPDDGESAESMALGDMDGDGDLDLATGHMDRSVIMFYDNTIHDGELLPESSVSVDIVQPITTSNAAFMSASTILTEGIIPIPYTLFDRNGDRAARVEAYYSLTGGGGKWLDAVASETTITSNLATGTWISGSDVTVHQIPNNTGDSLTTTLHISESAKIDQVELWFSIHHSDNEDLSISLRSPAGTQIPIISAKSVTGQNLLDTHFSGRESTSQLDKWQSAPYTGVYHAIGDLAGFHGEDIQGDWHLLVTDSGTMGTGHLDAWGIRLKTVAPTHIFGWDTLKSEFFGQSDNVVFRLKAYSEAPVIATRIAGTFYYTNSAAGPYQRAFASSTTFPFRVQGTQIQVVDSQGGPVKGALVYRIPYTQTVGGSIFENIKGAFHTNDQGYLAGHGTLDIGDQLLALQQITLPATMTQRYSDTVHLYYTNGSITYTNGITTNVGMSGWISNTQSTTVTQPGVQVLQVSPESPLLLFDVDVALEWDASKEPRYLDQLTADLKEASRYLYDFTNGQVALGRVRVSQNGDNWGSAHIVVHATNRLRPYAAIGGVVVTDTADFNSDLGITYTPGQIHIGSVWNRYGDINPNPGIDWPLVLAHELSHYLLGLEDTYLGIDTMEDIGGKIEVLVNVDSCPSAMGDVYEPENTEFIYDDNVWGHEGDKDKCKKTLSNLELKRNEWSTIEGWFPELITPTEVISGPNTQPFDFTTIVITDPMTATNVLANQAFYLDYGNRASTLSRSSDARVFLLRGEDGNGAPDFIYDLGNAIGDQNLVRAHGVQSGDKICVFDRPRKHAGCAPVTENQDHIKLQEQADWLPIVDVSLVNSVTFSIRVTNVATEALSGSDTGLKARVYPEYGREAKVADLVPDGNAYSGTLTVTTPALTGHVYVWSSKPQHQAIVAFSIGGNPGNPRSAGGGLTRAGIGNPRSAGGGDIHPGNAPAISPDGKLIFFATSPIALTEGQFYTIQDMANLPALPSGHKVIGQGYKLAATGFPEGTKPLIGSVSIQYNALDVLTEEADEDQLGIYFWNGEQDGEQWEPLKTHRSPYYNLVSAQSRGPGVYALWTGLIAPEVKAVNPLSGTHDITTSITVTGANFLTSTSVMLVDISNMKNTYVLETKPISSTELTAVVKSDIPPAMYLVIVVNHNQPGEEVASSSTVHFKVCEKKRVCVQE